jgi:hypothetical protein
MSNPNTTKVVTGVVRLSYEHVWEPASINGSNPKYSVSLIIPKSDTKTVNAINAAIDAAIEQGIGKFGGKKPNKAAIKLPLRDGDIERDDEAYANSWFVNANSTTAPQIVDQKVQPILDRGEVYSGCYARVSINFYAFNSNGNKGVACGLGNIQKVRDGEPLGGKRTGATLFRSIATSQTITFTKNNSNPTYWVAKIVPVPVRYSHHMIFMYTIGYNYSSSYNGQIGTICFDTTTNSLISIGQAAVNSSSWPSGSGAYNYLTYNSYGQGCMLANAVRTNSGYIRFWPGYNSNSSGYVYSMAEGGSSFSSYSTHYSSSLSGLFESSLLYLHVQVLRAGIHGLWEQPSILLFQGLRFILPGKGGFVMDAYNEKVTAYRLSMSMVESMMRRGIISEKDYVVIQRMLAEKYGISLSSIFFK